MAMKLLQSFVSACVFVLFWGGFLALFACCLGQRRRTMLRIALRRVLRTRRPPSAPRTDLDEDDEAAPSEPDPLKLA